MSKSNPRSIAPTLDIKVSVRIALTKELERLSKDDTQDGISRNYREQRMTDALEWLERLDYDAPKDLGSWE